MKMLKKLMASFIALGLIVGIVELVRATCASSDIACYTVGGTQKFRVSTDGNVEAAGTLTVTGASTITGAQTFTGATTMNGGATVSGALTQSGGAVTLSTTAFNGGVILYSQTKAQINALLPTTTGQMVLCNDCTRSAICISSGSNSATSVGAFVIIAATGTFAGSNFSGLAHCQ